MVTFVKKQEYYIDELKTNPEYNILLDGAFRGVTNLRFRLAGRSL